LNDLEEKKKALAAEAEVFRQTLKLELQNVRLYAVKAQRSISMLSGANPLVTLGASLAGSILKKRRSGNMPLVTAALMAWQIYQRVISPLKGLFFRRKDRVSKRVTRADRVRAENI